MNDRASNLFSVALAGAVALGLAGQFTGGSSLFTSAAAAESVVLAPAPKVDAPKGGKLETAVLAGGCFWGVQGVFAHVNGVKSAVSGYAGGAAKTASYEVVGSGLTGHAEAVKIVYDPAQVSYGTILRIFFSVVADPTELNYQGPDHGAQYRSAIFPTNERQRAVAQAYLAQLKQAKLWKGPIVTRIERAPGFFPAESYHQNFFEKNPDHGYIVQWDKPKVAALKRMFPRQYRARAAMA